MIRTGRFAALVLVAALAGCGGDGGDGADGAGHDEPRTDATHEATTTSAAPIASATVPPQSPSVTAPPSATTEDAEPVRQAEAAEAMKAGLRGLLRGGMVDFRYRMNLGATNMTETTGRAALDGGWSSSTNFSEELSGLVEEGDGADDYRMEVRAPGSDDVFMQMVGWKEPFAGCWLQVDPGVVPVGFLAMTPGVPGYVGVLGALKALGFDPEHEDSTIVATVSLRGALLLLTGQLVQALDVPPDVMNGLRVPARVYLEDGVLTDVSVYGDDIVEGVRDAGGEADSEYADYLTGMYVSVRYTPAPRGADPVAAPDAGLVITAEDMDAKRGC